MKKIKIYIILESFDAVLQNRFLKFCNSPFFNANDKLIKLAEGIIQDIRNDLIESNEESKQLLYQRVFKSQYDDQNFRTQCSKLQSLVEEFLCYNEFQKDKLAKNNFLLRALHKEKLDLLINKVRDNSLKDLQRNLEKSSNYFLSKYNYELAIYKRSNEFNKKVISKNPLKYSNIYIINEELDKFYILSKLRYINELITYNYLYKLDLDLSEFDILENVILAKELTEIPTIDLYYLLCKILIDSNSEDRFKELVEKVLDRLDNFDDFEQKEIFNSLFNFTIRKANKGNLDFYNELFKLYELGIETEIILVNKMISATSFRNIVLAALKINRTDYAKKFIDEKSYLLNVLDRSNAVNFSLARIAMHESNWRGAIEYISLVDFDDESYNLNSRLIMLNAYYELEEFDALESLIDSYSVFLRRNNYVSLQIAYLNHLRYLRKLTRLMRYDGKGIITLEKELQKNTRIINRDWLIKKVEELKN